MSPKNFGPHARSQNIRPVRLIRQRVFVAAVADRGPGSTTPATGLGPRKNFFAKRKNESRGEPFCFVSRKQED